MSGASRQLQKEFQALQKDPLEGIYFELINDSLFTWRVWVEGPKDTLFEGGIFEVKLVFKPEFPMVPPEMTVLSSFWHPNVYKDGRVCMSAIHPPGEDQMSGETAAERWLPTRTIASVMMSFVSMLSDPNFSSPANVDASVEWKDHPEEYKKRVHALCVASRSKVPAHVVIPHPDTDPDEHKVQVEKMLREQGLADATDIFENNDDFNEDDFYIDGDDDDDDDDE